MAGPSLKTGILAAIAILIFWSGFLVFARAGVLAGLTPYDVAACRFLVAGTLTVPFAWAWWPRALPLGKQALLVLAGPGALYSVAMFSGLSQASAAYGGVFGNGALPVFTMVLAFLVAGERPRRGAVLGAAIIIAGSVMVAWRGMAAGGADVATGIVLFLTASALIASYIYVLRHWSVTPRQALAVVNIPNALIYLPIWWLVLPSTMGDVPMDVLIGQMAFQGLGPGFLAVMIFAALAYHLGPTPTAAVSASVPAAAAVLAIPVLAEIPTPMEWAGIGIVTLGLALLIRAR